MNDTDAFLKIPDLLIRLGYNKAGMQEIREELGILFKEIDLDAIKQAACTSIEARDAAGLINSLKELMLLLENRGYYRPDAPLRLVKLLVNGINLFDEDIFALIEKAAIPEEEKRKEKEFLASCAAITQLGYILLSCIVHEVKAASSGPHVFLALDNFSPDSIIFVDFSIDSILEVSSDRYEKKENYYHLKNIHGENEETAALLSRYYSFFHVTSGAGLCHNIHNNLGISYDRIGRYREAVEELREALRLDPHYAEARNNLAVAYDRMGMYDEAERELKEAIVLNPQYAEAHSNLGNAYSRSGRYGEAIEELETALKLNPEYAAAHNNLGNVYAMQERNAEALAEFHEALRLDPDYAPARNNIGNIYACMGRHEEALREFEKALSLDPDFPEAHHGMGYAYYSLGSYDRAAQAMVRAVYLNPDLAEFVPEKLGLKVRQGVSRLKGR